MLTLVLFTKSVLIMCVYWQNTRGKYIRYVTWCVTNTKHHLHNMILVETAAVNINYVLIWFYKPTHVSYSGLLLIIMWLKWVGFFNYLIMFLWGSFKLLKYKIEAMECGYFWQYIYYWCRQIGDINKQRSRLFFQL